MSSKETFDVMAPVELPSGETVWVKCGIAWSAPPKRRAVRMFLTALPVAPNNGDAYEFILEEREDDDE